ncbi:MAG: PilZ domain-containing protein [Pseudomonadota bacterium]
MSIASGDKVFYRLVGERTEYPATICSCDEDVMVVETNVEKCPKIVQGQYIVVFSKDENYNAEVLSSESCSLKLKRLRTDKQEYFRIDDFFPVVARKVNKDFTPIKSIVSIAYGSETISRDVPDESIHPRLWEMMVVLNDKLNLILDRLNLETEVIEAEPQNVNISASGLRFTMKEKVEAGDIIEIKMLLPSAPPMTILTYGNAVSAGDAGNGTYAVALQFIDMDTEVRDRLIQYNLNRQREIIRRQKQMNE